MATGFTRSEATTILQSSLENSYVCLSTTTPDEHGNNFTEPSTANGYQRHNIGTLDTTIAGQVANKDIIFLFEPTGDCGSVTHVGLSRSNAWGNKPFLMAELLAPLSITAGYVPLIRAHNFVVGLDKENLESY